MRATLRRCAMAVTIGVLAAAAAAATAANGSLWTVDDVVLVEEVKDWVLTAEGSTSVWVRSEVVGKGTEERRVANLWVTGMADGVSRPLTQGRDTVRQPVVSPDGVHVAFLATRAIPGAAPTVGERQVWVIPLAGGEARPVTSFDRSVERVAWLDPVTLLVAAPESPTWRERRRREAGDTTEVVDEVDDRPPVRLFRVSLDGTRVERVTTNRDWIEGLAVSPGGRWAVVVAQQSLTYEFDQRIPPVTRLVDLVEGTSATLFEDGVLRPEAVAWAPDASGFYFVNPYSRHPTYRQATVAQLWFFDLARRRAIRVDGDWERGVGGAFAPTREGVVVLMADGVRFRPALYERRGGAFLRRDLAGRRASNIRDLAVSADGRVVAFEVSSATEPPQWYGGRLVGGAIRDERQLTDLNARYAGKPTGRAEVIRWKGARDEEVEGILHYPLDYRPGTRYPLVVDIHGGPAGTDPDAWSQSWTSPVMLWRQRGAFVLQVNYHGSAGYSLDWVESIGGGKYYELEVPDIERGVDELIRQGLVAEDRLALSGWSNGGILTVELITRSKRYRVAAAGAADVEWISDWGNVAFGAAFDNYYLGGAPWEIPAVYLAKSPLFRLSAVSTPTIVATGTADTSVPPGQSRSLFRALQYLGVAPVRLLLFPGEEHALAKVAHQRRKLEEELAWFDRYLWDRPGPGNAAVKEGSLLAGLLGRAAARRVGTAYGALDGGVLVPETVRIDGVEVGRFEVTRAQFAAFSGAAVAAGEENLPATGVSFAEAKAYASWLGMQTGLPFRLPTVAEARRWAAAAGEGGNTLDRWAGYAPNPDDAARLLEAVASLPPGALLLPVGSLAPSGEGIFDLDGNAAEWAVADDGAGRPVGPSAERPADARSTDPPAPAYIGFRVVADGR